MVDVSEVLAKVQLAFNKIGQRYAANLTPSLRQRIEHADQVRSTRKISVLVQELGYIAVEIGSHEKTYGLKGEDLREFRKFSSYLLELREQLLFANFNQQTHEKFGSLAIDLTLLKDTKPPPLPHVKEKIDGVIHAEQELAAMLEGELTSQRDVDRLLNKFLFMTEELKAIVHETSQHDGGKRIGREIAATWRSVQNYLRLVLAALNDEHVPDVWVPRTSSELFEQIG